MYIVTLTLKHPDKEEKTFILGTNGHSKTEDSKRHYYFLEITPELTKLADYLEQDIKWNYFSGLLITEDGKYFIDSDEYKDMINSEFVSSEFEIFPTQIEIESTEEDENEEIDDDDENCWVEYPTVEE